MHSEYACWCMRADVCCLMYTRNSCVHCAVLAVLCLHRYSCRVAAVLQENAASHSGPVQLDLRLLQSLVNKLLQLPVDVVASLLDQLRSTPGAAIPVSEEAWLAWPVSSKCPDVQLSGFMLDPQQHQDLGFTVAGRHVAAINLLARSSIALPQSQEEDWSSMELPQEQPQTPTQQLSSGSSSALPLQMTPLLIDLLFLFVDGEAYLDITTLNGSEQRYNYLWRLADRLHTGRYFKGSPKAIVETAVAGAGRGQCSCSAAARPQQQQQRQQ